MSQEMIQKFIRAELMHDKKTVELKDTDSLIEAGIIDSLGIQILISYLEKTFTIRIQDDEIVPDNFDSVTAIANFVKSKLS